METQDHIFPKQSGHEGQSHLCQKCGYAFPNPHPSAKHRRAHKKVCGKTKGHELGDDVSEKTECLDGSDGEHVSDDEGKISSGQAVVIRRKSTSGVGSRSSRSEEELFADCATDFTDGSGSGDASEAVMQRFYSIQNDHDDTNHDAQNAGADNTSESNSLPKDNEDQNQTDSKLTSQHDLVEAGIASQDHTSSSAIDPATNFADGSDTGDAAEAVMQRFYSIQNYSDDSNVDAEHAGADNTSAPLSLNDNEEQIQTVPKLTNQNDLVEAGIASQDHASSSVIDPVEQGMKQLSKTSHESDGVANGSQEVISSEQKPELRTSYDNSTLEASKDVSDVRVTDEDQGPTSTAKLRGMKRAISENDSEVSDSKKICSEDNDLKSVDGVEGMLNLGQKSIVDQNAVGESGQIYDIEDSEVVKDFVSESLDNEKVGSGIEEEKPVVPLEKVLVEGGISVESSTDDLQLKIDDREVKSKEFSGISSLTHCATDESPLPVEKLGSIDDSKMEGNERSEDDDTTPGHNLSVAGSRESERIYDHGDSDVTEVSKDVKVGSNDEESQRSDLKSDHFPGSISNKQDDVISAVDVPDSISQTDSLEGNWGSVSVMSALSDTPPMANTPASIHSQASPIEKNTSLDPKSVTGSQHSDSQTSGDPNVAIQKTEDISEIQTFEEHPPNGSAPSHSHVEHASLEGKRDEEIIEKVTEKNHTPLKTLLGEATARSRAESPLHYSQSSTSKPQKDEIPVQNNGFSKTEKAVHSSNDPSVEDSKEEVGKEWDSPARYPVNIRTEKKRGNSKPWMLFFCCSSVNAR